MRILLLSVKEFDDDDIGSILFVLNTSLNYISVQGGTAFRETLVHQKMRGWWAEGQDRAESSVSSTMGVAQPDIMVAASLTLDGIEYWSVSLVMEVKPCPGNAPKARLALAQAIFYLLAAFECCGCWIGVAFHAGSFVRMVADDHRVVYVESAEVSQHDEDDLSVEELINLEDIRLRYPWSFGSRHAPAMEHVEVLLRTVMHSVEQLRGIRMDQPLGRLPSRSSQYGEEDPLVLNRMSRLDLSKDRDLRTLAGLVRDNAKKAGDPSRRGGGGGRRPDRGSGAGGSGSGGPGGRRGNGRDGGSGGRGTRQGLRSAGPPAPGAPADGSEGLMTSDIEDESSYDHDLGPETDASEDQLQLAFFAPRVAGSPASAPSRSSGRSQPSSSSDGSRGPSSLSYIYLDELTSIPFRCSTGHSTGERCVRDSPFESVPWGHRGAGRRDGCGR